MELQMNSEKRCMNNAKILQKKKSKIDDGEKRKTMNSKY